ncbi:MAG TPA: hypothetical protein VM243_12895, partial [Phycisphaerae bacterium]|nr:hypothetical protein [Phycisphaerae bacterium]
FVNDPTLIPAGEAPHVYQLYGELREIIGGRAMNFPEAYALWKTYNPDAYARLKEQAATGATPEQRHAAEVDQATRTGFTAATQRQRKNALANQTTAAAARTTRLEKPLLDLDGALDAAGLGP